MRNVILMMLLAAFNSYAMAELVQIGGHGGLAIYTDSSSFHKEGNTARMWNVYDYKIVQRGAGGRM